MIYYEVNGIYIQCIIIEIDSRIHNTLGISLTKDKELVRTKQD